jgi:hypothetical protein
MHKIWANSYETLLLSWFANLRRQRADSMPAR